MGRFRDMLERSYAEKENFLGHLASNLTAAARDAELMAPNRTPPNINSFINNSPIFPTGDYFSIAQHAYLRNELVAFGVGLIQNGVAKAPLRVYDDQENEINDHPLRELIRRPNPFMGETALMELTVLHYFLSGNAFWVKVRAGRSNEPIELWPLRPDRMRIIPDKQKYIAGYIYEIAGTQYPLDTADVMHIKRPHPIYDYWGLSPLVHAMRRVAIDNEAADFLKVTLQNYGVPPLFITAQQVVSVDDAKRLHKELDQKWSGRNRGKSAILQQGMDVKTVGQSLVDMVLPDLDEISQKRVLVAIFVPPVLAGQEATFSNYDMARQFMYQNACMPLQSRIDDVVERDLLTPDFDPAGKLSAHFDVSEVPELEPSRSQRRKDAIAAGGAGFITQNQVLKILGEEAAPDGDVYLRPIATVAIPAGKQLEKPDGDTTESEEENALRKFRALNPHIIYTQKGEDRVLPAKRFASRRDLATLNRIVLHRGDLADRYQDKFRTWARTELARQSRDIKRAVSRRYHGLTKDQVTQITDELAALEVQWERAAAASVTPLMMGLVGDAAIDASETELGIRFDLSNQNVLEFVRTYAYKFADKTSDTSASEIRDLLTKAETEGWSVRELSANLDSLSESWDTSRAGLIARTETIRAANAGAIASYKAAGITAKVWIADGGACPYCAALNGKIIGIDDAFLKMGQSYQPEGAKSPMTIGYEDVTGPPAHPNCRCAVRAEVN